MLLTLRFSTLILTSDQETETPQEISPDGKYTIRLFDPRDKKWKEIEIDDYLPCMVHKGWNNKGFEEGFLVTARPFFCEISPGDGIWGALLEKAFAKMYGAWANLVYYSPGQAFICFTGWKMSVEMN